MDEYRTYTIYFTYDGCQLEEDETEFDAYSQEEALMLFNDFCKENGFENPIVTYVSNKDYNPNE